MVFSLFSILFIFRLHWWILKKICPKMKCQIPKLILGTIPSSQKFSSKFWLQYLEKCQETIALAFGIDNLCTYFFFCRIVVDKMIKDPNSRVMAGCSDMKNCQRRLSLFIWIWKRKKIRPTFFALYAEPKLLLALLYFQFCYMTNKVKS